jgi:F-type H+-transporting ATPase subunit alpha
VGSLKLAYAQFEELENFARFGTRLDKSTRASITHGQRIRACLQQQQYSPVPTLEQIATLQALDQGMFDTIPLEQMDAAQETVRHAMRNITHDLAQEDIDMVLQDREHSSPHLQKIKEKVEQALTRFDTDTAVDGEEKKGSDAEDTRGNSA